MHPEQPRKEQELAEHVEMWLDKMRRLEAHGDEYKLAPESKINLLRMLMTVKAKEYFDLWEGDRVRTDAAKSYAELLNKVKDYARRINLGTTAQKENASRRRSHGCWSTARRLGLQVGGEGGGGGGGGG